MVLNPTDCSAKQNVVPVETEIRLLMGTLPGHLTHNRDVGGLTMAFPKKNDRTRGDGVKVKQGDLG